MHIVTMPKGRHSMSPELIESIVDSSDFRRNAMLGKLLVGTFLVVPVVVSCGGVAMASTAGQSTHTTVGATCSGTAVATGAVSSAALPYSGTAFAAITASPGPGRGHRSHRDDGDRPGHGSSRDHR